MNFFSRSKKNSQPSEEPVIVESNLQPASISKSVSMPQSKEVEGEEEEEEVETETETMQENHRDSEYIDENPLYEYSSSLLESISFNMYSESTQNEFKKTIDSTKNVVFAAWSKVKDAYNYVAELNEEYITKEIEDSKSYMYKNNGSYFSSVGLDVSI